MAYKGKYSVKFPQKYLGDPTTVTYRSLWELQVMKKLDISSAVISWNSEEVIIPYLSPIDNKPHRYFMDFYVKAKEFDGIVREKIIEVKPFAQTIEPKIKKRRTGRYYREVKTYAVNQAKWKHARKWAEIQGMEFIILTEHGVIDHEENFSKSKSKIF